MRAACLFAALCLSAPAAAAVQGAPRGEPRDVAAAAFADAGYQCDKVSRASRQNGGSITATCDGRKYLIYIEQGYSPPVALPCSELRQERNPKRRCNLGKSPRQR
jgi:hypothetical protein